LKTNACRLLDQMQIEYDVVMYEDGGQPLTATEVAIRIGFAVEQVFKTLVTRGQTTGVVLAVIPGSEELDLKRLAKASGNKTVEMVHQNELLPLTGYVRGGVSPIGCRKKYPVYIDEFAAACDRISVSAGLRGTQIVLSPHNLAKACEAEFADLIHRQGG